MFPSDYLALIHCNDRAKALFSALKPICLGGFQRICASERTGGLLHDMDRSNTISFRFKTDTFGYKFIPNRLDISGKLINYELKIKKVDSRTDLFNFAVIFS